MTIRFRIYILQYMPRPSEIDFEHILSKATDLFWAKGFTDVSVEDLVRETGVNRYALYAEFGDKEQFFESVLDWYAGNVISGFIDLLIRSDEGFETIERFFNGMANSVGKGGASGCLMCNTSVELGFTSFAAPKFEAHFTRLRDAFAAALRRAEEKQELKAGLTPDEGADYLNGLAQGLFIMARRPNSGEMVRNLVHIGLKALKP